MKKHQVWSTHSWDHDDVVSAMAEKLDEGWEIVTVQYSAVSRIDGNRDSVYMSVCMKKVEEESPAG